MRRSHRLLLLFGLCFPLVLCAVPAARAELERPALQDPAAQALTPPAVAAGTSRVYIDPETGKMTTPPPGDLPDRQTPVVPTSMQNAGSTSSDGLVMKANTAPAGGVMVDLQGRFQSITTVTIGPDGKPVFKTVTGDTQTLDGPR